MKNPFYNILRHYGKIISSKDHETTEGHLSSLRPMNMKEYIMW